MWKLITLWVFSAAFLLPNEHEASVFYSKSEANQVLKIQKRANTFLEELKQGSLERECIEEQCDFEEASEIFKNVDATVSYCDRLGREDQITLPNWSVKNACFARCLSSPSSWCNTYGAILSKTGGAGLGCQEHAVKHVHDTLGVSCAGCKANTAPLMPHADGALWGADGDQCESNPCFNGTCVDSIGKFDCICNKGWEGHQCQYEVLYSNCSTDNGGCEHFCNEDKKTYFHRFCSCPPGYRLMENHTSCEPVVMFPCGRIVQRSQPDIPKVIGGRIGRKGDSPWQVMLSFETGRFKCGGVLIHPSWVLTAAHCVVGQNRFKLKFGKYFRRQKDDTEQIIIADKLFPHENYSARTSDNDIAMVHLVRPVVFNKYILPICLPTKNLAEQELMTEGTTTVVTGWGSQSEDNPSNYSSVLRYIEIPLVPRNDCINAMWNPVSENMLCAGIKGDNRDSCEGDSGGPMVTKFKNTWFLVGLVSWGEGCGNPENFGVYIKVSPYLDWIYQLIKAQDIKSQDP